MDTETTTLEYADLELSLDRLAPGRYRLRMTYQAPHSDAPVALYDKPNTEIALENAVLSALHLEPAAYGRSLGALLFADPDALAGFRKGYGMARSGGFGLRLRLVLDVSDPQLNDLAWETLTLPGDTTPLAQDERLALSRFLGSSDEAPVTTPMRSTLRGLAVVANPADGDAYGLSPVNAAWMLEGVREGLPAATWTELDSDGKTHLDTIVEHLRAGCDLFTLTCHGVVRDGEPWLYLETNTGMTDEVSGRTLAAAIATLPRKPLLAILASCASSGELGGAPLQAVGPLLVQAGVPAVIAMHGAVQQATARRFLAVMSQELARHGVIDRAAAAARWAVRNEPDWWAPVVWLRLASGRLWAETPPHVRRRADFYRHIDLPPHYIRRPELLAEIKVTVLAGLMPGQPVALTAAVKVHVDALHGMGGIGKTVVARALCDDPDVQAAYPDGLLWATVGQTPDLLPQLRDWIRELGGIVSENVPTVASLKNLLAGLLAERACLLVADDVWRVEDAQTFLIAAPGCRVLITTRDAAVAAEVGAAVQPVPLMAQPEALALLRAWGGNHLAGIDGARLAPVVERLGRLPLALKLAGPHFADVDPETWLKQFDLRDLEAPRVEGAHRSLIVAFGLSLDRLSAQERRLYAALTIFPEDESIPPVAVEKLWGELGGLTTRQARRLLRDLADRALLQMTANGANDEPVVVLHDLLRDLMALELGAAGAQAAHRALVAAYRRMQTGEGWHTAPDDGYLYGHLAYHLEKLTATDAIAAADLGQLFADDEWMRVRVPAAGYQYEGFMTDVRRNWYQVHQRLKRQIEKNEEQLTLLSESVRHALIQASIHSLSGNFIPEIVGQAVKIGVWPVAHGLSIAAHTLNREHSAEMFTQIAATGRCQPEERRLAVNEALIVVPTIQDEHKRSELLVILSPYAYDDQQQDILSAALNIEDKNCRLQVLISLIPHLNTISKQIVLRNALITAISIEGFWIDLTEQYSNSLAILAPYVHKEIQAEVLDVIRSLPHEHSQANALITFVPCLQGELLENALNIALAFHSNWHIALVLSALVPNLEGKKKAYAIKRALVAAFAVEQKFSQLQVFLKLIPHLKGRTKERIVQVSLAIAFALSGSEERACAFGALIPHLEGVKKSTALREGIAAVVNYNDSFCHDDSYYKGLVSLFPHIDQNTFKDTLTKLVAAKDETKLAHILSAIAPYLKNELLDHALHVALEIQDELQRSRALAAFIPHAQGEIQQTAIAAALNFDTPFNWDGWSRAKVLMALAPYLHGSDLQNALAVATVFQDDFNSSQALASLALHLPSEMIQDGLTIILALKDETVRSWTLTEVIPRLTDSMLRKVLRATSTVQDELSRSSVLEDIAPFLDSEMLSNALDIAFGIQDKLLCSRTMLAFVPHLQGESKTHALLRFLAIAQTIQEPNDRAKALIALIPHLEGEIKENTIQLAVSTALSIRFDFSRSCALAQLLPLVQDELRECTLQEGITAATNIEDEDYRARALTKFAPLLRPEEIGVALATVLTIRSETYRSNALVAFAPYLDSANQRSIFAAALSLEEEWPRTNTLIAIAPYLNGCLFQDALSAAFSIQDEWPRSTALIGYAPYVYGNTKERVLAEALSAALEIDFPWSCVDVLIPLIPHLPNVMKQEALQRALTATSAIQHDQARSTALVSLAPHLPPEMLRRALIMADEIQDEQLRSNTLTDFIPFLPAELLNDVIAKAFTIQNSKCRARVFGGGAPHLRDPIYFRRIRLQIIDDLFLGYCQSERHVVLDYLATPNLIAPPLFSPAAVAAVAEAIIDVTTQWRWL